MEQIQCYKSELRHYAFLFASDLRMLFARGKAKRKKIAAGVVLERDVSVTMRDGVRLKANVIRPEAGGPFAVIVSVTPYGKDKLPDRIGMLFMRLGGVRFGRLQCSRWTGFESPDPLFWVNAGYVVVQADVRGMNKSEGEAGVLTPDDAEDYKEFIEWAAQQPWSTGTVGLCGVSYLAMSQWRVAALRPPSLKAIIPWEGATDLLREFGYQDGVPETGFTRVWWNFRMKRSRNKRFPMAEDFLRERDARPLDDDWWASKRPDFERINTPALVCGSWSDQGLHTCGSLIGFERIGSDQKWLFTHGRRKWETFYSAEARDLQRRFMDHFLRGAANGWERTPPVRLEVRHSRDKYTVRSEATWPISTVCYQPLYLDAKLKKLSPSAMATEGKVRYKAARKGSRGRVRFLYRFDRDTELTGSMGLTLWVSTSAGHDLDLFVLLRKFDGNGREVFFYGYNGFAQDVVAKGWLRVSHRALDPALSRPGRPWHTHRDVELVKPGEIVPVRIEVLASSTLFEAGSHLGLDILGQDGARYPAFRHKRTVNLGFHTIHTGGRFGSCLQIPVVDRS